MTIAAVTPPDAARSGQLLKVLGVAFGLAVLIGNTIGMGIMRTPGEVAARVPSVTLFMGVWVIGALYALLGALSIAELASMHPTSGGQFPLVHRALGPYAGFVVGWTDWVSTCGSAAAVAIVLAEYTAPFVPALANRTTLAACFVVLGFALMQWRGIRIGDRVQQVTSLLKAISLIVLAAVALVKSGATTMVAPAASTLAIPSGAALVGAVILALQSVIYTYDGWTGPIYFSEEMQEPGREIPRTMIGGVLIVLAIYLALNAAFLRVVPIQDMAGDKFVAATVAVRLFGPRGDTVLRLLTIVSLIAAVNAMLLMASRVPFSMARERLMPAIVGRVNAGGTPVAAHFAGAGIAILLIATNTFDRVLALLAFLFVSSYAVSFTSLFVMRRREPLTFRPFRVPGYPIVPGIVLVGSLAFMVGAIVSDQTNSFIALGLVAVSWPAYRLIRRATASAS